MPRLGVVGTLVWDDIHGRSAGTSPIEEWGGIAYALAALDAALPAEWEIVPLIKVGRDFADRAATFLSTLRRLTPGGRCVEVPAPNNRVTLRYEGGGRRSEQLRGGVPGWTWPEIGPMIHDLDALHINFISGAEMDLATAAAVRHAFGGTIYADLHSLFLGITAEGYRTLQGLPDAATWFRCFDLVQLNEEEMMQLGPDPLSTTALALGAGVSLLAVTLGERGVAYTTRPGFDRLPVDPRPSTHAWAVQTARLAPPTIDLLDPTGCGDVFGATCLARLLAGDSVIDALTAANHAAARNAAFHGATHLAAHLRGEWVLT